MIPKGKAEVLREKFLPVPLVPPHGMTWDQARAQTMNRAGAATYSAGDYMYIRLYSYVMLYYICIMYALA
jgi:hypothetical protein